MLLLSLLLTSFAAVGLVIGHAILSRLDPSQTFDRGGDRAIVSTWLGLLLLGNVFLAMSLFGALSPGVCVAAVVALVGASLWSTSDRKALITLACRGGSESLLWLSCLALGVGAYCSHVVVWYDSGLYHVQVIRWLSELGIVPGTALIHSRFGFVSSWFTLPAAVDHGILKDRVMALPGALCLFLLAAQSVVSGSRLATRRGKVHDLFVVAASLLAIPVVLAQGMAISPSPDLPIVVLAMLVAWAILGAAKVAQPEPAPAGQAFNAALVPLALAIGAASIKLSALPLVVVSGLFYLSTGSFNSRKMIAAGGLVMLGLLPLAAAGVMASGCALYPASLLCSELPWSLGPAAAQADSLSIREWARWGGATPEEASAWNWIIPWLRVDKISAALLLLSLLAALRLIACGAHRDRGERFVMAAAIAGIAFMLYAGPSWRFGMGFLLVLPALAAMHPPGSWRALPRKLEWTRTLGRPAFLGMLAGILIALHAHALRPPFYRILDSAIRNRLIASDDHPRFNLWLAPRIWNFLYQKQAGGKNSAAPNVIFTDRVGDVDYRRPDPDQSGMCWNAPVPCAPHSLENLRLRDRGKGISSGFERAHVTDGKAAPKARAH